MKVFIYILFAHQCGKEGYIMNNDFGEQFKEGAERAKNEAAKFGRQVAEKFNNAVGVTKLNYSIHETEIKIEEIYASIGKGVYGKYKNGEDVSADMTDLCVKVDELNSDIESMRDKIAALRKFVKCPQCGTMNSNEAAFCSKCGAGLSKTEEQYRQETESDDTVTIKAEKPESDAE